jgi:hypothetical protein
MDKNTYSKADFNALMRSDIPQSLVETKGMRFDDAEDASLYFARELDYIKAQSYDVEYPELTALSLFPISNEVNPGAETVTYYSYDKTGVAKIINNYATDLPRADVKGKPSTGYVKSVGASYGYSVQDMRASRMASKSLDVRKAEAARYAVDFELNRIAWAGDKENGLIGVLSPENDIPLYAVPNGASGKTSWESKTADEILADLNGMQKQVSRTTKNVERPDTLALPADVYIDISTRQIPNTGYTVKKFLLENAPYLKDIVSAAELQADAEDTNPYAAQGKNVALLFKKDARKMSIEHPLPFYQHPLQTKGLEIVVPCEARTAGAIIYYPLSALIAVGV